MVAGNEDLVSEGVCPGSQLTFAFAVVSRDEDFVPEGVCRATLCGASWRC